MKIKTLVCLVLAIAVVVFGLQASPACAGGGGPLYTIELTPSVTQTLFVGQSATFTATVRVWTGTTYIGASSVPVTWDLIWGSQTFTGGQNTNSEGQSFYQYSGQIPMTNTVRATITREGTTYSAEAVVVWNPIDQAIPEVPFGTIVASLAMALGIAGFVGLPKLRKRL